MKKWIHLSEMSYADWQSVYIDGHYKLTVNDSDGYYVTNVHLWGVLGAFHNFHRLLFSVSLLVWNILLHSNSEYSYVYFEILWVRCFNSYVSISAKLIVCFIFHKVWIAHKGA